MSSHDFKNSYEVSNINFAILIKVSLGIVTVSCHNVKNCNCVSDIDLFVTIEVTFDTLLFALLKSPSEFTLALLVLVDSTIRLGELGILNSYGNITRSNVADLNSNGCNSTISSGNADTYFAFACEGNSSVAIVNG